VKEFLFQVKLERKGIANEIIRKVSQLVALELSSATLTYTQNHYKDEQKEVNRNQNRNSSRSLVP
jgi:hypothetical protein